VWSAVSAWRHTYPATHAPSAVSVALYDVLVKSLPRVLDASSAAIFRRLDDDGYLREAAAGWPTAGALHLLRDHPLVLAIENAPDVRRIDWDSPHSSPFRVRVARIRPLSGGRVGAKWVFRGRKPRIAPERVKTAIFRVIRAQISRLYRRRWSLDQDVHGAVSGGERRADIRLRISANRARGIATSAI